MDRRKITRTAISACLLCMAAVSMYVLTDDPGGSPPSAWVNPASLRTQGASLDVQRSREARAGHQAVRLPGSGHHLPKAALTEPSLALSPSECQAWHAGGLSAASIRSQFLS